ncbi:hypothetical protein CF54_04135 [Streptomyces sp. Tu 6176]|uniref:hypothetical protein n=1 Tax=Streptomyces sp. Tu 6176 TaxID=1470557 RepID=UPI00044CA216|nr:hypothetical protein [Streptomyces sp. Tu 6176]EYT83990.1 hypothetical protein CF54_04135 [Streptomyces sp. Tu 6176]
MKIRADVAELLRAGHSDSAIARQLHVDYKTAAAARKALGLPKAKSGYKAAATPADLFWRRVTPTDDGHMEWAGYTTSTTPAMRHGGRSMSAYRVAYRIATGREPEGRALPSCGRDGCVMPGHHADRADRARAQDRAAVCRAWARGLKKTARVRERQREKRLDVLYDQIFGATA